MTSPELRETLGFIGGTGPLGRGLAVRWARAGHTVHLGSRRIEKAQAKVAELKEQAGDDIPLYPATNEKAAEEGEIIIVSVPYEAQATLLPSLSEIVGDKVVCNVVNPMEFDDLGPRSIEVEQGSAAEQNQALWPQARVVSSFHDVSSKRLLQFEEPIDTHVLICGDDKEAAHRVAHLASQIEGMWGVYCGPLRNSQYIEDITPLIIWINREYKIQAGLLIDGIERDPTSIHAHPAVDSRA